MALNSCRFGSLGSSPFSLLAAKKVAKRRQVPGSFTFYNTDSVVTN